MKTKYILPLLIFLAGCGHKFVPPEPVHENLTLTIIGTIDSVSNGSHGGQDIVFRGLDNNVVNIKTCDLWPVSANHQYEIDTYRVWVEDWKNYGSCYHESQVTFLK